MKCLVKRQVQLFDAVYRVGLQDIPVGHAQGWFFDALVSDGSIVIKEPVVEAVAVVAEAPRRGRPPKVVEG